MRYIPNNYDTDHYRPKLFWYLKTFEDPIAFGVVKLGMIN